MRQFVRQQTSTLGLVGSEAALVEIDVVAVGECLGAQSLAQFDGVGVGVYADPAEVMPKAPLEVGPRRCVERLAGRAERLMHDGRRFANGRRPRRHPWQFPLLLAGGAFAAEPRRRGSDGKIRVRDPHQMIGDTIGFVLKRIIDLRDWNLLPFEEGWRLKSNWLIGRK